MSHFATVKAVTAVLCAICCGFAGDMAHAGPDAQDEAVYQKYLDFQRLVKGGRITPNWLPDGSTFWYAEGRADDREIIRLDPATDTASPLFDVARLRAALAEDLGQEPAGTGVPFEQFQFAGPDTVSFSVEGESYSLNLDTYLLTRHQPPSTYSFGVAISEAERAKVGTFPRERLMGLGSVPSPEALSPDGSWIAGIKDHNLVVRKSLPRDVMNRIGKSACDQCSYCTEFCPRYLLGYEVQPHKVMRSLGFTSSGSDFWNQWGELCCACGLCTLYACPEDLYPKDACADNKLAIRQRGLEHPSRGRTDLKAHSMQEYRHIPVSSLMKKLGLDSFRNVGPLLEVDWQPDEVRIPLQQHAGAPAVARVAPADRVSEGDVIGTAPEGLGVPVHASISGEVTSVGDTVTIRRA